MSSWKDLKLPSIQSSASVTIIVVEKPCEQCKKQADLYDEIYLKWGRGPATIEAQFRKIQ